MMLFRPPQPDAIEQFLEHQAARDFTYDAVGATAGELPAGYVVDHARVPLGNGRETFETAKAALGQWRQFQLGWLSAQPVNTPLAPQATVAVVARCLGIWWLNACRIVYVVDEQHGDTARFGFAYGTLPDHVGAGEERFLVELTDHGQVWYDVLAFSRPHHLLARVGYPYMRLVQKKFGQQSARALKRSLASHAM